jgi:vacuolar iron transporter family protein
MRDFEKGVEHSQLSKQRMHALEHSHTQEAIRARLARVPRSNFLRDWIYGGIDGAVTTFAIIAGVVGADLSTSVFLPTVLRWRQATTLAPKPSVMIASSALNAGASPVVPEGEREEIRQIFAAKGFAGDDLERIVAIVIFGRRRWQWRNTVFPRPRDRPFWPRSAH